MWEFVLLVFISFLTFLKAWLHWQYFLLFQHKNFEKNPLVYFEEEFKSVSATFETTVLPFVKFFLPVFIPKKRLRLMNENQVNIKVMQLIVVLVMWWVCLLSILFLMEILWKQKELVFALNHYKFAYIQLFMGTNRG